VKDQSPKIVGQGQKVQWVPHPTSWLKTKSMINLTGWKMSLDLTLEEKEVMDYV